jgi:hypothetical protein
MFYSYKWATVAQPLHCLTKNWKRGFDSRQGQWIILISSASRPALWQTQPPRQLVQGALSPGVKVGRGVMLIIHPGLPTRLRKVVAIPHLNKSASMACNGTSFSFLVIAIIKSAPEKSLCLPGKGGGSSSSYFGKRCLMTITYILSSFQKLYTKEIYKQQAFTRYDFKFSR